MSQENRIRKARRFAGLTQSQLAILVGVHRSAVAQWEMEHGSHPSVENLARISVSTHVSFEWLATARGQMALPSNLFPEVDTPALLLEYSAQGEDEVRALTGLRRLDSSQFGAVIDLIESLANGHRLKLGRRAPYSR